MTLLPRFSYLPFQTKVLLPVLALLVALPAVTVTLVNRHVEQQSLLGAKEKLSAAEAVLLNSLDIRDRSQQVQFKNAVNEPRFKAVSQLDDADTMRAYLRDILQEFESEVEALLYTASDSAHSVGVRRAATFDLSRFQENAAPIIETALGGDLNTSLSVYSDNAYNVISVPVFLSNQGYPIGSLTIAVRLDNSAIKELKSLTNTELILALDSTPIGSTLSTKTARQALQTLREQNRSDHQGNVRSSTLSNEHFHILTNSLARETIAGAPLQYVLLSSYEDELDALRYTRALLLAISLGGIGVSVAILFIHVRRITSPLRLLKEGADAVGRGDLSHTVECDSNDECGDLARAFNQMTGNLLSSRQDLETTVAELRETQHQLIQREERLRESEEGLRLIIEGARDHAIFTIDDSGNTLRWNKASERILGYTTEEAKRLNYADLFDPERNEAGSLLQKARRGGQASYEGWRLRKDGSRFWADITLSRLPKAEGSANGGFVEIARDITARKEAEIAMREARDAAESSNRAKSEFLANMSHEFRTPMNGIIGMAGLLSNTELSEEQRDCAETIRLSADSLLAIIDDVLDISKIESGDLEVAARSIDLVETIDNTIQLFRDDCSEKSIELGLVITSNAPQSVVTDPTRLRQILVNIVGNAIKFTHQGGVIVTVDYHEHSERLRISIKDTGIGIPEDKLDSLFDPFFQVQSSASRQYGGTGLGLPISRNIAKLLGGAISVESELGVGSTFRISLHAPKAESAPPFETFPNLRALLLADNPIAREAIQAQLIEWEFTCQNHASHPERLRNAIVEGEFQLLIVDDSAARPDTLRALLDCRKELGDAFPPIIRLVSSKIEEDLSQADRCASLAKPLSPPALNRKIHELRKQPETTPKGKVATQGMPKQSATPSQAPEPASGPPADDESFAETFPLRILVVEDNPINTKVLVKMLAKLGYAPETAANGKEGLAAAESQEFDVVLMDLQMPEMDGLECARRILSSDAVQHPLFISAFTANARDEDRRACDKAGMHDFVAKPARLPAVRAVLERGFHWTRAQQEAPRWSSRFRGS